MSVDAVTRQEMYLQYLAGDTAITLPEPVTRIEKYWWDIAKRIESGIGTGGGITVDSALSETSTNPVQNKVVSKRFGELSEQKTDKSGMTLDKHTDGLIYLFVDGKPVGNGIEITGEVVEGDVIGTVDENNNILLSGAIPNGTYTLKYLNNDGTYTEVGSLVVGAIEPEPENPNYTNILTSGAYTVEINKRWSGSAKAYSACNGMIALVIPIADVWGKTIRFKGFTPNIQASSQQPLWMVLGTDKSKLDVLTGTTSGNIWDSQHVVEEDNGVYSIVINDTTFDTTSTIGYLSVNMAVNESDAVTSLDGLIMTIDEEIV